jgi:hypothetical protein
MLSVIILNVVMLRVVAPSVSSVIMLRVVRRYVIMLSLAFIYWYANCHYAECHYSECSDSPESDGFRILIQLLHFKLSAS